MNSFWINFFENSDLQDKEANEKLVSLLGNPKFYKIQNNDFKYIISQLLNHINELSIECLESLSFRNMPSIYNYILVTTAKNTYEKSKKLTAISNLKIIDSPYEDYNLNINSILEVTEILELLRSFLRSGDLDIINATLSKLSHYLINNTSSNQIINLIEAETPKLIQLGDANILSSLSRSVSKSFIKSHFFDLDAHENFQLLLIPRAPGSVINEILDQYLYYNGPVLETALLETKKRFNIRNEIKKSEVLSES